MKPFTGDIIEVRPRDMTMAEVIMYNSYDFRVIKLFRCRDTGWSFILTDPKSDYPYYGKVGQFACSGSRDTVIKFLQEMHEKMYDGKEKEN